MKFTLDTIGDNQHVQEVENGVRVYMNGIRFKENVISKIAIFKFQGSEQPYIFVELYSGNIEIATWVVNEVVIAEDKFFTRGNETEGKLNRYIIRLPYDFE